MLNTDTIQKADTPESDAQLTPEKKQEKVERAFSNSGAVRKVHNLELQPYSASREAAAQAMGLHYGHIDPAGQALFQRTKLYPGAVRDLAIVMWLCAKATEDEIDGAGMEPKAASRVAVEWARGEGLFDTGSDRFSDFYNTMFEILEEVWDSRSKAQKKTTSPGAKGDKT